MHTTAWRRSLGFMSWLLVGGLASCGCAERRPDFSKYVPEESAARSALASALDAWRKGEPAGPIDAPELSFEVFLVDSQRQEGQTLSAYEILGEAPGDGPRTFAVRLELSNPDEELTVRYYLVGVTPIYVFRQEDYDMIAHWEHPMSAADGKSDSGTNQPAVGKSTTSERQ